MVLLRRLLFVLLLAAFLFAVFGTVYIFRTTLILMNMNTL